MREELTLAARVRSLEVSVDLALNQLKDIQLRLDLLIKEKLTKSPSNCPLKNAERNNEKEKHSLVEWTRRAAGL